MSLWARRLVAAAFLFALILIGIGAARWQPAIDRVLRPETPPRETEAGEEMRLYFADGDAQCVIAETRLVRWLVPAGGPEHADEDEEFRRKAYAALEQLAEGPAGDDLWPVIPDGARVLSVARRGVVVVVDYSDELRTNHGGGSAGEMLTVAAVAATLSEFPGVEAVQILLDGRPAETLVGHFSLLEPIRIDAEALEAGRICWDGIQ